MWLFCTQYCNRYSHNILIIITSVDYHLIGKTVSVTLFNLFETLPWRTMVPHPISSTAWSMYWSIFVVETLLKKKDLEIKYRLIMLSLMQWKFVLINVCKWYTVSKKSKIKYRLINLLLIILQKLVLINICSWYLFLKNKR